MFCFGLGTFPALFIVSYFGQHIMLKATKYLNIVFSIFMFANFLLLLNFATKLLK
jgi:sulfite exporter TauE/SafE